MYSNVSYVAATKSEAFLKVPRTGDDESLHDFDAVERWNVDGTVDVLRWSGHVLLQERTVPEDDLSVFSEDESTRIAVALALRLRRPATPPFRPVTPEVVRWLHQAAIERSELVPVARELFREVGGGANWLVPSCGAAGFFGSHSVTSSPFLTQFLNISARLIAKVEGPGFRGFMTCP